MTRVSWRTDYEVVAREPEGGKVLIDVWAPIGFVGYATPILSGPHKLAIPERVDFGPQTEVESDSLVHSFTIDAIVGQHRGKYTVRAEFFAPNGSLITTDDTRFEIR